MRMRRIPSTSRCSSGVRSTARATYRYEASAVLKAAANTTKAPHFELVKVRISAAWKQREGSVHLGTQRDASPGGGGPSLQGFAMPTSDSFSSVIARRPRAETSHTGRPWHPEDASGVQVLAANLFIENGDGRQASLQSSFLFLPRKRVKNELNPRKTGCRRVPRAGLCRIR